MRVKAWLSSWKQSHKTVSVSRYCVSAEGQDVCSFGKGAGEAAASLPGERFPHPSAWEQLLAQSRAGGRGPPALRQGASGAAACTRLSLLRDLSCHHFRRAVDNKYNKLLVCRGHRIP